MQLRRFTIRAVTGSLTLAILASIVLLSYRLGVQKGEKKVDEMLISDTVNFLHLLKVAQLPPSPQITNDLQMLILATTDQLRKREFDVSVLESGMRERVSEAFAIADRFRANEIIPFESIVRPASRNSNE